MYDLIEDRCIDDVTINNILLLHCKNKEIPCCRESVLLNVTEDVKMCLEDQCQTRLRFVCHTVVLTTF